jgi:hypothetical protein
MRSMLAISLFAVGVAALAASEVAEAQCNSLPCTAAVSSSSTAFSITNNGTGRALEGRGTSGIGVIGIGDARGVVGTQGVTSCAGTYAIGGCATTGDGILGRSPNRAVIGVQGGGSCAGRYAVGGCATTGDGVVGRSRDGLAGRFEGRVLVETLQIVGGSDLAEPFEVREAASVRPGMVVSIDPERAGHLRIADKAYDPTVAGIVSGANGVNPGLTMGQNADVAGGSLPVALTGRVYALADAADGPIAPGDLLTTSGTPGHAMKVTNHAKAQGAIIGKAMTPLERGRGMILVLVALQ